MKILLLKLVSFVLVLAVLTSGANISVVAANNQNNFSDYIVENHPRLYVTDFTPLKEKYLSDPVTKKWYEALIFEAESIMSDDVIEYDIQNLYYGAGKRRIIESQKVLDRFYCLAFAAAVENSQTYAQRLWLEIEAAINLPTWNQWHWLETAEMTHSMAIAYDWCYKFWNDSQKLQIKDAIIKHGLSHATREYDGNKLFYQWVYGMDGTEVGTNWTIVCNTGVLMGALAIYEEAPELCNTMINNAVRSMKAGLNAYGSDGSFRESLGYWLYATQNLIMAVDGFESAIGGDFDALPAIEAPFIYDFSKSPGISITPDFPIYANGPSGVFNYGDANGGYSVSTPAFMWLGNRFDTPHYTKYHVNNLDKSGMNNENIPLNLLWYEGDEKEKLLPMDRLFQNDFASMRSSWSDDALYVTLKGGTNGRAHQHYDIGTFCLDFLGTRFARMLGAVGYDWKGERTEFYKSRTEGQNTMLINPDETCGQNISGTSEFESFYSGDGSAYAILNMTGAYDKAAKSNGEIVDTAVTSARRGIKLYSDKTRVLVQDEIKMDKPSEYYWFMHTLADITLYNNNKSAVLSIGGKSLYLNVLSDKNAQFKIMDAVPLSTSPNPDDQPDSYGKKLAIHLENITEATVAVEIDASPGAHQEYVNHITFLDDWHPEADVIKNDRRITVYGKEKTGRFVTMVAKSPLGRVCGVGQVKANEYGEYTFSFNLPKDYENGNYLFYICGSLYKTLDVTDGKHVKMVPMSYTLTYELPTGFETSVLVAAEYSDGQMVQLAFADYDLSLGGATVRFDKRPLEGNTIKFMYLNNLTDIIPLKAFVEIIARAE